jgi:hypothetical protein
MQMTANLKTAALKEKHARIEAQINDEMKRARPDEIAVRLLKRRKLMIKDKLHELIARRYPQSTQMGAGASG